MEKLKNKMAASDEKMKTLGVERSQLAADKASADRELRMALSKVETLDKEAEKLRATNLKIKETQAALATAEKKACACEAEEHRMSGLLLAKTDELESTQHDLLACADERDLLLQQHEELVSTHAKTTVDLQDLLSQHEELEKLCQDMNQQIKTLQATLALSSADKQALEMERAELNTAVEGLKHQVKIKDDANVANLKVHALPPFSAPPLPMPASCLLPLGAAICHLQIGC